jgi:hypothetical protein
MDSSEAFERLPLARQILAVRMAALICSQTWKENHDKQKWLRLWSWMIRKCDYALELAELRNYLMAGRRLPNPPTRFACETLYGGDEVKGRALGSPILAQLYQWSEDSGKCKTGESVWDLPYSFIGTLYFAHLEMDGRARVENDAEAAQQAEYDAARSEAVAEEDEMARNAGLATPPPDI